MPSADCRVKKKGGGLGANANECRMPGPWAVVSCQLLVAGGRDVRENFAPGVAQCCAVLIDNGKVGDRGGMGKERAEPASEPIERYATEA